MTLLVDQRPPASARAPERGFFQRLRPGQVVASTIMLLLLVGGIWSIVELRINVASLIDSADNAVRFVNRMFPLNFPPLGELLALLWETLAIVILATALSIALSIPIALLGAWNTTPGSVAHSVARFVIVLARATPDLVLAIVFFRLFGLGGLPGVLAMGLHSIGMVGKLYADSLEGLPTGPHTAMQANGATWWQRVVTGYLPAWTPQLVSVGLYRLDINLRGSVLLGYVGVGGIGLAIADALRALNYQRGMALALAMLVVCILVELMSGTIRQAIHGQSGGGFGSKLVDTSLGWALRGTKSESKQPAQTGLPPWTPARLGRTLALIACLVLIVACVIGSKINLGAAAQGLVQLPRTVGFFFPPDMAVLPEVMEQMVVTVQIALASTLLGAVLAIPVGVLAARNVFPNKRLNTAFRVLIVCVRGIPELILAIIFVVISGLGGVAGTLALSVGAVGMLGKLVADSLEETDPKVQDALRANGATRLQVFFSATVHQVTPAVVSHVMYVLDNHIRSATLLGVVGAGGIGFLLLNAARVVEFPAVTTVVLAILVTVLVVEGLSIVVRKALA